MGTFGLATSRSLRGDQRRRCGELLLLPSCNQEGLVVELAVPNACRMTPAAASSPKVELTIK